MNNNKLVPLDQHFTIDYSVKLGQGATGTVYLGFNNINNQSVAVKVINLSTINTQIMQYLHQMEITALQILNNPYIIKCVGIIQNKSNSYIITEVYNGFTLSQHIKKKGPFSEIRSLEILQCILKGYEQILKNKILHRDMKTDNIILHNNQPKIIDFGYCQVEGYLKPNKTYNVGSPSYMSPESFNFNIYNEKTEIWAIGAIFYECLTGKTLHEGETFMEVAFSKLSRTGVRFPPNISQFSVKIVCWCLNFDPKKRPNVKSLLFEVQKILIRNKPSLQFPKRVILPKKNRKFSSSTDLLSFNNQIRGSSPNILNINEKQTEKAIQNEYQSSKNYQKIVLLENKNIIRSNKIKIIPFTMNQISQSKDMKSCQNSHQQQLFSMNQILENIQNTKSKKKSTKKEKDFKVYESQRLPNNFIR